MTWQNGTTNSPQGRKQYCKCYFDATTNVKIRFYSRDSVVISVDSNEPHFINFVLRSRLPFLAFSDQM